MAPLHQRTRHLLLAKPGSRAVDLKTPATLPGSMGVFQRSSRALEYVWRLQNKLWTVLSTLEGVGRDIQNAFG